MPKNAGSLATIETNGIGSERVNLNGQPFKLSVKSVIKMTKIVLLTLINL